MSVRLHDCSFSDISRRNHLTAESCSSSLYNIPAPSLEMFFEPYIEDIVLWMRQLELGSTTLHFDGLWFPVMASVCCKEQFP